MEDQCSSSSPLDLEDIEDLVDQSLLNKSKTSANSRLVVPKVKKKPKRQTNPVADSESDPVQSCDNAVDEANFLPGQAKVYVKTWGCSHNVSDGEYMAGQLAEQGYKIVQERANADLWILNSCTVKNPSEDHFRNEVDSGLDKGKKVVVAGCVPQGRPNAEYIKGLSVIGVQQIDRVVEVVEETLKGNQVRLFGNKKVDVTEEERLNGTSGETRKAGGASLALPKIRKNPLVEIIAINTGCLNACTYCKTKHARGQLGSYSIEEIVDRARTAFADGVVEIWLTSEDTGAWGRDLGQVLPDLLEELVKVIPEGCRLRLGMTNPPYILDHLEPIAKILNSNRVYSFLHVPVQAGSDSVLEEMKREYTNADFCKVVNVLRKRVPGITIATDIICGFPTETESDFQETMALCKKYKFPVLYINQFYPRPGTPAAKMKRIPTQDVKKRTKELTEFFHSYEPYNSRIGQRYKVLVTETAHDKEHYVGHNEFYEQVLVPKDERLMGKLVEVEIVEATKFSMRGELIRDKAVTDPAAAPRSNLNKIRRKSSLTAEESFRTSMLYKLSIAILVFAGLVRLFQVFGASLIGKEKVQ